MPKHVWTIASVLCNHVMEEKDGSLSIIRLTDRVTLPKPAPEVKNPGLKMAALFAIRGDEVGDHILEAEVRKPSGKSGPRGEPISFRIEKVGNGYLGLNVNTAVVLELEEEGMYW